MRPFAYGTGTGLTDLAERPYMDSSSPASIPFIFHYIPMIVRFQYKADIQYSERDAFWMTGMGIYKS